jgi:hypothetical protein
MPIFPTLRSLRQEDHEFKDNQGYVVRPCPKKEKTQPTNQDKTKSSCVTTIHDFNMIHKLFKSE